MPTPPQETLTPTWNERHYSPKELAAIFNVSSSSIILLFRREPGVLLLHPPRRRGVRKKTTMRVPESVVERVYRRFCGGKGAVAELSSVSLRPRPIATVSAEVIFGVRRYQSGQMSS